MQLSAKETFRKNIDLLTGHFITASTFHKTFSDFLSRKEKKNENVTNYFAELTKISTKM